MILGLRLCDMPAAGTSLSLADLQLLNLLPVTNSDKQVVHEQLEATAILSVLDRQPETVLRHGTAERLEEKYGWLCSRRVSFLLCRTPLLLSESQSARYPK